MMNEELLEQLDEWHEEDEFENIVNAIEEIAPEDRDYVLISHLGRALNNLERYEEAIEQFMLIEEEGTEDPLWHYRMGVAHYYLKQYDEALREFTIADELEPDDEDTLEFLGWIRRKLAKKSAKKSAGKSAASSPAKPMVNVNPGNFWNDSEEALQEYVSSPPSDELIASVQEELVFKLPASYIAMMKQHNGGIPANTQYPSGETAADSEDRIAIAGIMGIGRDQSKSLCGASGSRFIIEQGGYPEIGVVIAECEGPGVIMLDYRESGNDGEPEVIHVNPENHYRITTLAPNFDAFVRGLV